jgi:hypothetical protein
MDPAATWRELLDFASRYADGCAARDCEHEHDLIRVSELINALAAHRRATGC